MFIDPGIICMPPFCVSLFFWPIFLNEKPMLPSDSLGLLVVVVLVAAVLALLAVLAVALSLAAAVTAAVADAATLAAATCGAAFLGFCC
jgi:hypothetical protein